MPLQSKIANMIPEARSIIKDILTSRQWRKRPHHLAFEITAACDARCVHCPRQKIDRPKKQMDFNLFRDMVDQAAEMHIPLLVPNGYGEILLVDKLSDYFEYISSKKHRFRISVNTNAHRMTDEAINLFLTHNVHMLNISIDGAATATAQSIRVGLDTMKIEDNIRRLLSARKARRSRFPLVRVGMVVIPQNAHEINSFLQKWRGVADYVGFGGFSTRLDSVGAAERSDADSTITSCCLPFRELNIWADGRAVLCCEDWNEEYAVGDLTTQTLQDIWHGEALRSARSLHMRGLGRNISICAKCNIWRKPSKGAVLWG